MIHARSSGTGCPSASSPKQSQLHTPPNSTRRMKLITVKTVLLVILGGVQLASAQTIPPSLAAPPGSVNTNVPGFKMRIVQGNSSTPQTAAAPAEALISGRIIDPTTGLPLN